MAFGIDYVTGPPIADMKAAGVSFVCRYTGYFSGYDDTHPERVQSKVLTPGEAKTLASAGISIVSNWEWYANRALEGASSGAWDAQEALKIHLACGGPANKPIYFSVDFDATPANMSALIDYFHGIASVIGLSRTGVYGSYYVVKALFDAGVIAWGWQTYAWSGGIWESRAHIQQYDNGVTMAGLSVDYNRSMKPDFGQWIYGDIMIPNGWHDDGKTLTAPNGHRVVLGFRDHVLNHPGGWDAGNQPLEEEWHASPLEVSNPSLGDGQKQGFTETTLEYTPARGTFEAWQGQEIVALRAQIAALKAQAPVTVPVDIPAIVAALKTLQTYNDTAIQAALKTLGAQ